MSVRQIGCCGAYCQTCRIHNTHCKGCKIGYESGRRDISKARCRIKACCIGKGFITCADCGGFDGCDVVSDFYRKTGYKYVKYRQALEYIRARGYSDFLKVAAQWTHAYGKYPPD